MFLNTLMQCEFLTFSIWLLGIFAPIIQKKLRQGNVRFNLRKASKFLGSKTA